MAGIAGAYVSLVYTSLWTEGLIAGRGWIAVALVVFATWRPGRCLPAPICSAEPPWPSCSPRAPGSDCRPN